MHGSWIGMSVYYLMRFIMNVVRSIEPIIWAVIAVVWVGLGPFAGVIALTVHSIASLGKLYSEAIEGIDHGPIEAVQATGATKLQTIMFAVIPQMVSPFISFSIYRWDINVRMSTIIGMVGGGGVGFVLLQYVRLLDYQAAGIAVWFIAVTVAVLDYVSAEIRERMI
jgi:phosphonate transport system permease protein